MEKMLSLQEAGERLGLSSERVRQYVHAGTLPAYRVGERKLVVPEAAVEKHLNDSKYDFNSNEKDNSDERSRN